MKHKNINFSDFNLETHTLLIPNNHALNKLSPETLERLLDDDEFAKQVLCSFYLTIGLFTKAIIFDTPSYGESLEY